MKKRHSRRSRRRRNPMATLLYVLVLVMIIICLGFLYKENRQKNAEYREQQKLLMEEELTETSPQNK